MAFVVVLDLVQLHQAHCCFIIMIITIIMSLIFLVVVLSLKYQKDHLFIASYYASCLELSNFFSSSFQQMIDMLRPASCILSFFLRVSTKCSISSISFSFSFTFLRKAYISTISSSPKLSSFRLCFSPSLILSAFSRMAMRSFCKSAWTTLRTCELSISYLMLRVEMLFLRQCVLAEVFIFCTRSGLSPLAASMRFEFVYIRKRQSRSFSFLPIVEPTFCNWLLLVEVFG